MLLYSKSMVLYIGIILNKMCSGRNFCLDIFPPKTGLITELTVWSRIEWYGDLPDHTVRLTGTVRPYGLASVQMLKGPPMLKSS